jgi:hypothetical protein
VSEKIEIEQGHRDLLALLDAAERATTEPEVTLVVDSLHAMLPAHFTAEEGAEGDIAGAMDQPGIDQIAGELAQHHLAIAEALRAVRASSDPAALRALAAAIREYERQKGLRAEGEDSPPPASARAR